MFGALPALLQQLPPPSLLPPPLSPPSSPPSYPAPSNPSTHTEVSHEYYWLIAVCCLLLVIVCFCIGWYSFLVYRFPQLHSTHLKNSIVVPARSDVKVAPASHASSLARAERLTPLPISLNGAAVISGKNSKGGKGVSRDVYLKGAKASRSS